MNFKPNRTRRGIIFSHMTYVFALDWHSGFALLQSAMHETWSCKYASSMKGDLRYTPTDCFETFPFPATIESLENIGQRYHDHRQQIMLSRREGLTKIYHRFHASTEESSDIQQLREMHIEMDQRVAEAYGWRYLDLGHGFHQTKQGVRFTISEAARVEVLDRLLALNHEQYEEEVKQGLHVKRKKNKGAFGKRAAKKINDQGKGESAANEQAALFE